jgi:hypothetical protein
MIQKIKSYLLPLIAVLTLAAPAMVPLAVSACASNIGNSVSQGATDAAQSGGTGGATVDCTSTGQGAGTIGTLASDVVNIFSVVVGAAAVIMIIYSGFRYITSGGDSGRVGGAKNSLIYAIIGLVIVAVAQLIVHYVLNQANNLGT